MRSMIFTLVVLAAGSVAQGAGPHSQCCDGCGIDRPLQRICRLVCETEEVTRTRWGCKCEDVCLPGPTKTVCCTPGHGAHCDGTSSHCHVRSLPTVSDVRHTKRLVRIEYKEEVPVHQWVVEYLCAPCAAKTRSGDVETDEAPSSESQAPMAPPLPPPSSSAQNIGPAASPAIGQPTEISQPVRIRPFQASRELSATR